LLFAERREPAEVEAQLQAQLPHGLHVRGAEDVPVRRLDGTLTEKVSALLGSVEYHVAIVVVEDEEVMSTLNTVSGSLVCFVDG
jgi:hypothetical protein